MTGPFFRPPPAPREDVVDVATLQEANETRSAFWTIKNTPDYFRTRRRARLREAELAKDAPAGTSACAKKPYKAILALPFIPATSRVHLKRRPQSSIHPRTWRDPEHGVSSAQLKSGRGAASQAHAVIATALNRRRPVSAEFYISHAIIGNRRAFIRAP